LGQKTPKMRLRVRTIPNPTYTPSFTANTFFRTLQTLPTHFQHLCRDACPCFSVDDAQTKAFASTETLQRTMGWGPKGNMVPITSLLHTTSLRLHLCLLYPTSHPRAFPNLHSFPSNSPPPQAILSTQTPPPDRSEKMRERLRRAFLSCFPLFLLVVTIYHWIAYKFYTKPYKILFSLLLPYLVRIKKHVLVQIHLCHSQFNITVQHLSPTTSSLVLVKYPITSMCDSS
jgi:hypothetical protein